MLMPHRRFPCRECPFRRDTEPGQFPAERYEALQCTIGTDDDMRMPGDPLFACHKSPEGAEEACAGWLAVCGIYHLTIRIAISSGHLPPETLSPPPDWPELFANYAEVAEAQGR